jgi:hypothetical protein
MNFGLAASAEAVSTSARFGIEAHEPRKRRSWSARKQRAATANEIEQAV